MKPLSLSYSAVNCYECCPKRYEAEWLHKAPGIAGSAANLGSALHRVVQLWIESGYHLDPPADQVGRLRAIWDEVYWQWFPDLSRHEEGWQLLLTWIVRQDWDNREVLSTEMKKSFPLHTSQGDIPFNYICDRVDRFSNGDIEVIDYKSVMAPISGENLRNRLQARCYALAAHLEYPEARRIWVTFDLFRHDTVGTVFTAEECDETYAYLHALAERVLADDEPVETLNSECRWCIRKSVCTVLNEHIAHAGQVSIGDFTQVVARRAELNFAKQAIEAQITELDGLIMAQLAADEADHREVDGWKVSLSSSRRRVADPKVLAQVLPYDRFAELATISVTGLDELLKSGELDPESASLIRRAISWRQNKRSVVVKPAA